MIPIDPAATARMRLYLARQNWSHARDSLEDARANFALAVLDRRTPPGQGVMLGARLRGALDLYMDALEAYAAERHAQDDA